MLMKDQDRAPDLLAYTTLFARAGEANTDRLLEAAYRRARELSIRHLVIASETGRSALKAVSLLGGSGVDLVVVTHVPASTRGPSGDIPIGLMRKEYAARRSQIEASGARILQGTRPFAPPSRSIGWHYPTPEALIDRALELFGAGMKIAVEVALMATDAGILRDGEEVVSCGGTFKGLDTAIVVRTAYTMNSLKDFEVLEVIAKPRSRVKTLPEYESPAWQGDLSPYYEDIEGRERN
jgi:hypothetical protein